MQNKKIKFHIGIENKKLNIILELRIKKLISTIK